MTTVFWASVVPSASLVVLRKTRPHANAKPSFGSGTSNTILCFPVILFSHASKSGLADAARRAASGSAAALSGANSPPRPTAAAPATTRPRNPRRWVVRLSRSSMVILLVGEGYGDLRRAASVGYATSGGESPFGQSWIFSGKSGRGRALRYAATSNAS